MNETKVHPFDTSADIHITHKDGNFEVKADFLPDGLDQESVTHTAAAVAIKAISDWLNTLPPSE